MSTEHNNGMENSAVSKGQGASALVRKQWHGPYFGSMRLELIHNRDDCVYEGEFLLNTQPLQIDMLARAEDGMTWVLNAITRGFRKHNIIEFKSPDDGLNLDVFYKTVGYGCLYKAQESRAGEIMPSEISITFIRESKPEKLLQELDTMYGVEQSAPGIYRIEKNNIMFPVQILVLREMDWKQHIWVTALQKRITPEHARCLVVEMQELTYPDEREWADSVLQLAMANKIFERLKEETGMCQALRELMADEIKEELQKERTVGEREGRIKGEREGRRAVFETMKRLRQGESEESLAASGFDRETLQVAMAALRL